MRRLPAVLASLLLLVPLPSRAAPNDPFYPVQWGMKKIQAEAAWSVTRAKGIIVAVVDTGVDFGHPDLRGRLLAGRDFADDDEDPTDDNGHGTLIAGIVAAATANGIGVASVAPEAKLLPVRVLGTDGSGSSSSVAAGIRWAVSQGASVVNLSLAEEGGGGDPGFLVPPSLLRDPGVDAAIREAAQKGATVVVAAGNNSSGGKPETAYRARDDGVLVVGATTPEDRRAAYANYGPGLDLVAPGGGSPSVPGDRGCTQDNSIVSAWWNPKTETSDYGGGCGTSMAVAFVSGVAAMLHAQGLTNAQATDRIRATADRIGSTEETGAGRLNAARAVGASVVRRSPSPAIRRTAPRVRPTREIVTQGSVPSARASVPAAPSAGTAPSPGGEPLAAAPGDDDRTAPAGAAAGLVAVSIAAHVARLARVRSSRSGARGS